MNARKKLKIAIVIIAIAMLTAALFALNSCAHKHKFGEYTILELPTCTEPGLKEAVCNCGVISEVEIPVTDHIPDQWVTTIEATCTASGNMNQYCRDCNTLLENKTIPALGHDFIKVDAKEPTCSEEGYNAHETCSRCNFTTKYAIPKLPHTPGAEADCVNPQYCTVCEAIVSEAKGHRPTVISGTPATCTRTGLSDIIECLTCHKIIQEQIEIPKRAHTPVYLPEVPATCSKKGLSAGQSCAVCEYEIVRQVEIPKTSHTFTDVSDSSCNVCGKIRVLDCDHPDDFLDVSERVNESCRSYGISSGTRCKKCNEIIREAEVTECKNHTPRVVEGFAATPTKPGLTDGRRCTVCLITLLSQEIIPAGDDRSPVVDVSDEDLMSGGNSVSIAENYNKAIIEKMTGETYRVTTKKTTSLSYSYGGTTSQVENDVITVDGQNWSSSYSENNVSYELIFADGTLYAKYSIGDQVFKNKCSYISDAEARDLLGLDFTNSILMSYEKVTYETLSNGNIEFTCKGFNNNANSTLHSVLNAAMSIGQIDFDNNKITASLTIDKDHRILDETCTFSVNVTMPYIGDYTQSVTIENDYEYGNFEIKAPSDADSYTAKNGLLELFE